MYVKKESVEKAKVLISNLTPEQKVQIQDDICEIIGEEKIDEPVVLDFEAIRVLGEGKFELDLVHLFNKEYPIIFKLAEGKYMIDVPETFQRVKKEKEGKKTTDSNKY
jgi:predicted  nucleic acid-binding Zn-ribbon protein